MKKFTAILLTVIMVASLFISCNNSIAPNIDETVSVSFDEATSRSLTASLENFVKGDYFWKYAAQKNASDDTGLNSGATGSYDVAGALWIYGGNNVTPTAANLGSVAGFSQGIWDFKLFAYKQVGSSYKLAYQGEVTGVSLKKGSANTVTVTVSPVAGDTGTLILADTISLAPAKAGNTPTNLTKVYTVTALGSTAAISPDDNKANEWTLNPGAYKVNVDFVKDGFTYASGSVVATVYSNITTTVSGSLAELVTKAEFDSEINPDVMNKEASSDSVDLGTLTQPGASVVTLKDAETEAGSKVIAKVPAAAASQIINTVAGSEASANTTIDLALRVDTVSATNTTLELEIGMQATVTQKDVTDKVINQTTQKVTELKDREGTPVISVVTIKLQPGLQNVAVKHNGTDMVELSVSTNGQGYSYDANTGSLTIKTSSFSPFMVTYDEPAYVAKVGDVSYRSLQGAVDAVTDNGVIYVLQDLTLSSYLQVDNGKTFSIDCGGYTITGGIRLKSGFVSLSNGVISHSYCPIYVYTTDTDIVYNSLTIEEDMTVTGGDDTYGLIVYQNSVGENNYGSTVSIYGTITDVSSCVWVMGNIKTDLKSARNPVRINISGNATLSSNDTGVSENGAAIITVSDNSKIESSEFAIEVRAGKLEIEGGTFTATATPSGSESNGSGSSTSGAAIAISQHQTTLPISVNITGGDFSGYTAFYQSSPETNSDSSKLSLSIEGGSFVSTNIGDNATAVYSEDCTGFITGGTFSSDPSEYLANGCVVKLDGGKYVVSLIIGANTELNTGIPAGEDVIDNQTELESRLSSAVTGETKTLYIGEGTFNINNVDCNGKTIVFVGSGYDTTTLLYGTQPGSNSGEGGACYSFEGANVTFKDVTLQDVNGNDVNYKGFVRSNGLTFENCLLMSRMTYLGENGIVSFKNCTFNTPKYAAWIYSSQTYNFENCLFESPTGRFLNIYSENNIHPVINATECMFIDTSDGTDSNAVFNIKPEANTTLTIQDCVVTGASPMYNVAASNGTTVTVDKTVVYPITN